MTEEATIDPYGGRVYKTPKEQPEGWLGKIAESEKKLLGITDEEEDEHVRPARGERLHELLDEETCTALKKLQPSYESGLKFWIGSLDLQSQDPRLQKGVQELVAATHEYATAGMGKPHPDTKLLGDCRTSQLKFLVQMGSKVW